MPHAEATRERDRYSSALDGLWSAVRGPLGQLESLAADPEEQLVDAADALPALQYSLHCAGELAAGIEAPPQTRAAHEELQAAFVEARDVTGDVLEVLDTDGPAAAGALVHEWRGALLRVRLARWRSLERPRSPVPVEPDPAPGGNTAAALSLLLVVGGTGALAAGAIAVLWPLWALGLALVALGFFLYRT